MQRGKRPRSGAERASAVAGADVEKDPRAPLCGTGRRKPKNSTGAEVAEGYGRGVRATAMREDQIALPQLVSDVVAGRAHRFGSPQHKHLLHTTSALYSEDKERVIRRIDSY